MTKYEVSYQVTGTYWSRVKETSVPLNWTKREYFENMHRVTNNESYCGGLPGYVDGRLSESPYLKLDTYYHDANCVIHDPLQDYFKTEHFVINLQFRQAGGPNWRDAIRSSSGVDSESSKTWLANAPQGTGDPLVPAAPVSTTTVPPT